MCFGVQTPLPIPGYHGAPGCTSGSAYKKFLVSAWLNLPLGVAPPLEVTDDQIKESEYMGTPEFATAQPAHKL